MLERVPPRDPHFRHRDEPDSAAGPGTRRPDLAAGTRDALNALLQARVLVWGMPGIGKTALARHIANLENEQQQRHPMKQQRALPPSGTGKWRDVLWMTWGSSCTGVGSWLWCAATIDGVVRHQLLLILPNIHIPCWLQVRRWT